MDCSVKYLLQQFVYKSETTEKHSEGYLERQNAKENEVLMDITPWC